MTLNIVVIRGAIKFVVHDDKTGKFEEVVLGPDVNYQRLTLAPGLWMAFAGVDKDTSMLMDIIPKPHDPTEADRVDIDHFDYTFF